MLVSNNALAASVLELTARAAEELFAAYGVTMRAQEGEFVESDVQVFSGAMGFVGRNLRGSCLLVVSEGPLLASCAGGGNVRDWVGELTNQLVGRLKAKLLALGVEVALSTPIILSGVRLRPVPRAALSPRTLRAANGEIVVWVEVESTPDFSLSAEPVEPPSNVEGDIVLF